MIQRALQFILLACCLSSCQSARDRGYVEAANKTLESFSSQAAGSVAQRFSHITSGVPGDSGHWIRKGKKIEVSGRFVSARLLKVVRPKRDVLVNPPLRDVLVMVGFIVGKNGIVLHPEIIRSGEPRFNDRALEAVARWKYEPATYQGHPVDSQLAVPLIFLRQMPFPF